MTKKTWIVISVAAVALIAATVVTVRIVRRKQEEAYRQGQASTKGLELGINLGISNQAIAPIAAFLAKIF